MTRRKLLLFARPGLTLIALGLIASVALGAHAPASTVAQEPGAASGQVWTPPPGDPWGAPPMPPTAYGWPGTPGTAPLVAIPAAARDALSSARVVNDVLDPSTLPSAPASRPPVRELQGPLVDSDGDTLDDTTEKNLGLNPMDADSDCDNKNDNVEVGNVNSPTDTDNDGRIDALESNKADIDGDGNKDETDPSPDNVSKWQVGCANFKPFAIADDLTDASTIQVHIIGGSAVSAASVSFPYIPVFNQFIPPFYGCLKVDGDAKYSTPMGGPPAPIELYDDGTHGDATSGDKIWSRGSVTGNCNLNTAKLIDVGFSRLTVTDNNGTSNATIGFFSGAAVPEGLKLGFVPKADVKTPTNVDANFQVGTHVVNLSGNAEALQGVRAFNAREGGDATKASKALYTKWGDDFDFIIAFADRPIVGGTGGLAQTVKNDTQGIGSNIFDNTAAWGSSGMLQGFMTRQFGGSGPTVHEIFHRWAVNLDSNPPPGGLGFGQRRGGGVDPAHWGVAGTHGQHGGFDPTTLVDKGSGVWETNQFFENANGGDAGPPLSPIERYLAGCGPASDVQPIPILDNPQRASGAPPGKNWTQASAKRDVTIAQIQAKHGARNPAWPNTQKAFKTAFLMVTQMTATPAELAWVNVQSEIFGSVSGWGTGSQTHILSWQEASGNCTMDTTITVPSGATPTPTTVPPTATPTTVPPTATPTTVPPTPTPTPTPQVCARADCNCDGNVNAGDLTALTLENFDGDGTAAANAAGGTFAGDPVGCDANNDSVINAADLTCATLIAFGQTCP